MFTKQISQLNNNAIALLQANNYKEAAMVLTGALRLVQKECSQFQEELSSSSQTFSLQWSEQACEQPEGNNNFIYTRPLVVSPFATSQDHTEIAAAIMFNLALSVHLRSCELGAKGASNLQKALALYQRARSIVPGSPFLETVILFNAGIIHQEFFQFREAQICFELTEGILFSESDGEFLYNDDVQSMILNITTFQEPEMAAAA